MGLRCGALVYDTAWEACEDPDGLFANGCAQCGLQRWLPFSFSQGFACRDVGLECGTEPPELLPAREGRASASSAAGLEEDADGGAGSEGAAGVGSGAEEGRGAGEEAERTLFAVEASAGSRGEAAAPRGTTEEGGADAAAGDAERGADLDLAALLCRVCTACGSRRALPFDPGEGFVCGQAGLACGARSEEQPPEACCACCGEPLGQAPSSQSVDEEPLCCAACAAAWAEAEAAVLAAWGAEESWPSRAGSRRGGPAVEAASEGEEERPRQEAEDAASAPEQPDQDADSEAEEELSEEAKAFLRQAHARIQLLWKVLIYNMTAVDAEALFRASGLEPPSHEELVDLRSDSLDSFRRRTVGLRLAARGALKSRSKKGGTLKRYLNNELVTVSTKDKYLYTEKETAEAKARTSVELYVLGIGRGGRHAVKTAREPKKKGPVSHK